jgi:hypothetical protein
MRRVQQIMCDLPFWNSRRLIVGQFHLLCSARVRLIQFRTNSNFSKSACGFIIHR